MKDEAATVGDVVEAESIEHNEDLVDSSKVEQNEKKCDEDDKSSYMKNEEEEDDLKAQEEVEGKREDEVAEEMMDRATGADVEAESNKENDSSKVEEQIKEKGDEKGLEVEELHDMNKNEQVREDIEDSKQQEKPSKKPSQVTVDEKEETSKKKEGEPKTPVADRPIERLVAALDNDSDKNVGIEKGRGTALKDIPNVSTLAKVMQAARKDKKMAAKSSMASSPQSARTEKEASIQENRETQTVSHDEFLEGLSPPCVMESKNESSSSKSKNTSFKKSKANPPAEEYEERAEPFAADLETVEVLMRMKNINSTIRLKTKLEAGTANPNPICLVNPWDFFDVPMEEKEYVSTTHTPTQFCPDWSLKINDQVADLEVARTWVRESVLPRDAKLAEKLSEVDLVNLAYSNKASGHVWDNEVYRRVLDFPARTEKLRSDLAKAKERIILVDSAHKELKEKRDADAKIIEKMKSDTLDLKKEKNKLASELSEVKSEKEKLLKRVEEAESTVLEVDNLKAQVAKLMKSKNELDRLIPLHEQALKETAENAARSAELNYKTSDRFVEELSVLIAPMMNHGYTLALDAAKKLWPYVDPENPLVSEFYRPGQDAEFESRVDELRTGVNVVSKYLNPPSGEEFDVVAPYLRDEEAKLENISPLTLPAAQDSDNLPGGNQLASVIENFNKHLVAYRLSRKKSDDAFKLLHTILFGISRKEKQKIKIKEKLDKCVKEKLVEICDVLDIQVSKANARKEDVIVKLIEFLEAPHATTSELLAEKEQSSKGKKRNRGSKSAAPGSASKQSSKSLKRSKNASGKGEERKGTSESEEGDEEEEQEEDHEKVNGLPERSEDEMSEQAESEEKEIGSEDDSEEKSKLLRASKKTPTVKKSVEKGKSQKTEEKEHQPGADSEEEKSKQKHSSKKTPTVKKSVVARKEKVEEKVNESAADSKKGNSKQKHASKKTPTMKKSVEKARSEKVEEEKESESDADSEEEKSKKQKHVSKKTPSEKKSVEKAKCQKVKVSEKSPKPNAPPTKTAKRSRDSEITNFSPNKSKKKKVEPVKAKAWTPMKSAFKEITDKRSEKAKSKSEEGISRPSDDQLRHAIFEILQRVDFNTATFTDILRQLANKFNTDLTSQKASIQFMIREELTRMAD